jgi:hypothetical protein
VLSTCRSPFCAGISVPLPHCSGCKGFAIPPRLVSATQPRGLAATTHASHVANLRQVWKHCVSAVHLRDCTAVRCTLCQATSSSSHVVAPCSTVSEFVDFRALELYSRSSKTQSPLRETPGADHPCWTLPDLTSLPPRWPNIITM